MVEWYSSENITRGACHIIVGIMHYKYKPVFTTIIWQAPLGWPYEDAHQHIFRHQPAFWPKCPCQHHCCYTLKRIQTSTPAVTRPSSLTGSMSGSLAAHEPDHQRNAKEPDGEKDDRSYRRDPCRWAAIMQITQLRLD